MNDLNLEKKNEKEHLIEGVSDMSKENLEKKIFLLNTKRDELKKEKNNIINNLNNSLLKLKKQISVLENDKINLLNDEKSHIEKSQILKRTLNTKMNKMNKHENKIKTNIIKKKDINKKEQIEEQQEDNTLKEDNKNEEVYYVKDIKEDNNIQHYNENNKYMYQQNIHPLKYEQNVQRYDREITPQPSNFIESLLEDQTPEYKKDINPIIKTQEDVSKPWEENGNKNIYDDINNENMTKYNTKKKKKKNNSNVFLPQFEEDILLKLQKTINMKLNEKKEKEEHIIEGEIKEVLQEGIDDDANVVEEEIKEVVQDEIDDDKDSDINNLFKYNDKICEFINICEHYKIHMNSQQKPELKKTYNSIEHNIQYLSKHIETAKKDNILLKKKLKRSTDPLFLLTLEQKNKQLCIDIENRKKEIKFLKESIRKNEKLLDSNKKKPNPVSLEKEYRNLLNQQSNLCSRLIQLQNGSRLYEESIQR
ncbi:hypothetical protein PFMALIP_05736 [Plasmodium falciparum MaliPS096_E11]|uniref:Uncharacterized protein n=1 Tax=Plasmodium falciparum MaliPS096_E11 TaxID=1036727 RepID=A0A024WG72_PLAFA|nr:hypothetical protein PFMALIP_05736 [Plasmodium falciparum MaliPS096_E11]